MAKNDFNIRIAKCEEIIKQEEENIIASKGKIKKAKKEIKAIMLEKNSAFASNLMELLTSDGQLTDEELEEIFDTVKTARENIANKKISADTAPASETEEEKAVTDFNKIGG